MQIGSNFNLNFPSRGVDPNTYAQQYASQNNISVDKAKEELSSKYGAPKAPDESIFTFNNISSISDDSFNFDDLEGLDIEDNSNFSFSEFFSGLFGLFKGDNESANDSMKDQDPDAYAQQYATENDISVEEAKEELKKKFGDPEKRAEA